MSAAMFENYVGKVIGEEDVEMLSEAVIGLVESEVRLVEKNYNDKFSLLTENVVTTLASLAEQAADQLNEKVARDRTTTYLVESLDKIRDVLVEAGLIDGAGVSPDALVQAAEERKRSEEKLNRALEVGKKALEIIDTQKKSIERKDLEMYVLRNTKAMSDETQKAAVDYIVGKYDNGDITVEDAEFELINFLEKHQLPSASVSASPATTNNVALDDFENSMAEFEQEISKPVTAAPVRAKMFESADPMSVARPAPGANFLGGLLESRGVKTQNVGSWMSDTNTAQLEAVNSAKGVEGSARPIPNDVNNAIGKLNAMARW